MAPLFTIAVTTFDRLELLKQTISSVLSQTFGDFEIIIGNDNPARPLSPEMLGISDPRVRVINNETNKGEFDNMNSLLQLGRGRYFTWLADDDEYAPRYLESIHQALLKYDYRACVFTSFQNIGDGAVINPARIFSGETQLLSGRDFVRRYLAREIETVGTMSMCETKYLRAQGGLGDVSLDGKGYYSEYLQILRAAKQEQVCYIDAPLVYFRIHERSWSASLNTDLEQYKRAAKNLVGAGLELFQTPALIDDFDQNLTNMLRWFLSEFVAFFRRGGGLSYTTLIKFLVSARAYLRPLRGSRLYWRSVRCLIRAEVWLFWAVCKQKFLSAAPEWMIDFAYAVRKILFDRPRPAAIVDKKLESRFS